MNAPAAQLCESEQTSTTFCVNTLYRSRPDGHTLASFPLLFSGHDGDESYTVVPPLLFGRAADAEGSSTFCVNTFYRSREDGHTLASFDPYFQVPLPSRYYDPAGTNLVGRPIDMCYVTEANGDRAIA